MPRKRIKKVFMSLVSFLFALSVAYFAVLPPTSAWFYQQIKPEEEETFIFGYLALEGLDFTTSETVFLPAATKLEIEEDYDYNETLFDDALHFVSLEATNTGTLPARVYVTVEPRSGGDYDNGLHYFFYEADEVAAGTTVRDLIADNNITTYVKLDDYNIGDGVPAGDKGRYILVLPGQAKQLRVAFWVDYNVVSDELKTNTNNGIVDAFYNYDVNITFSAGQNTDGWFARN